MLDYNPIKAAHINIPRVIVRPNAAGRGGNALREEEYTRVLEYLLSLDVHYLATELHWIETKLHYAVKLTLLQMVTGLRVSEACRLVWDDVVTTKDNYHGCVVHAAESKTHKGRTAIFFDERVYDYLLAHKTSSAHVIAGDDGAPSTANRQLWVKRLYNHLAETLNVPLLYKVRTHVWRTTLNTLYLDVIPDAVRAAQFGHTTAVNENSYTDTSDLSVLYRGIARKNKNLIP